VDRGAVILFAVICAVALLLFGVGVWKHSALALILAIVLFIVAPFIFGLRVKT